MINPFTLKTRGFFASMSRPPTEEERIGERNNRIIGYALLILLIGLLITGLVTMGKFLLGFF